MPLWKWAEGKIGPCWWRHLLGNQCWVILSGRRITWRTETVLMSWWHVRKNGMNPWLVAYNCVWTTLKLRVEEIIIIEYYYGWRNDVVKYNCCRAPAPDTGSCLETGENLKPELNWGFDWQRIIFRIIFTMVPNIVWSQGLLISVHNVVFGFLLCWSLRSGSILLPSLPL